MQTAAISSENGVYALLALDQVPQLAEQLKLNLVDSQEKEVLNRITTELMSILSPESTGVIVSPEHTFHTLIHKDHTAGLLLSLEQRQSAIDPLQAPQLAENWGPEYVKNNYGVCKLELYYHPQEENALKKKQLVAEIHDYCQYLGIDFLLALNIFSRGQESEEQLQENKLWAIEEFRTLCDIMALQPPHDPLAIATVTAELDIPWLFCLPQVSYEVFKEGLRPAMESGAAGFIIGHSLWTELPEPEPDKFTDVTDFIRTTARDRLIELRRIIEEENTL